MDDRRALRLVIEFWFLFFIVLLVFAISRCISTDLERTAEPVVECKPCLVEALEDCKPNCEKK